MLLQSIEHTIQEYLSRFDSDAAILTDLTMLIQDGVNITSRKEFRGHVTCGAILFEPDGSILMVHHRALGKWFLPGGHIEGTDECLRDAAIRELIEETDIKQSDLVPFNSWVDREPFDVDRHIIPANVNRNEPAHIHWDFRYIFQANSQVGKIQLAEIMDWKYLKTEALPPTLRDRIRSRLSD
jgi:8-oxo-dGTP pyrophosphatase MutT (NUDIX family)